ncbi:hypothetical protein DPMN_036591 [Dreissena polymorpha]|uniref:Uncharacterized protein n=1 Tax=Dreissena polymorpha TaxID=45954 RepID=A0A9D4MD93_DREPO|nr:hypothetical protein DPMN_036591 [Dreissena polymorpha]
MPFRNIHIPRGLINLFSEKIIQKTLQAHNTPISIGGRPMSYLTLADYNYLMVGTQQCTPRYPHQTVSKIRIIRDGERHRNVQDPG